MWPCRGRVLSAMMVDGVMMVVGVKVNGAK